MTAAMEAGRTLAMGQDEASGGARPSKEIRHLTAGCLGTRGPPLRRGSTETDWGRVGPPARFTAGAKAPELPRAAPSTPADGGRRRSPPAARDSGSPRAAKPA